MYIIYIYCFCIICEWCVVIKINSVYMGLFNIDNKYILLVDSNKCINIYNNLDIFSD